MMTDAPKTNGAILMRENAVPEVSVIPSMIGAQAVSTSGKAPSTDPVTNALIAIAIIATPAVIMVLSTSISSLFPYTTLFRSCLYRSYLFYASDFLLISKYLTKKRLLSSHRKRAYNNRDDDRCSQDQWGDTDEGKCCSRGFSNSIHDWSPGRVYFRYRSNYIPGIQFKHYN